MNKLTSFTALAAAALIGNLPGNAWPDETTASGAAAQAPAPTAVPGQYPAPYAGGHAQPWQQAQQWRAPQQYFGQFPPRYPTGGQYQAYPTAPAAPRENPLSTELKQTQEALAEKSSELENAQDTLEKLLGRLQESRTTEANLTDKIAYGTREQQALRVRVTELTEALKTANTTLEQQHQLINNHQTNNRQLTAEREQLQLELAGCGEQLTTLQSDMQAATQALVQARSRASVAGEAFSAARVQIGAQRDALSKLEAELERLAAQLESDPQAPTE